MQERIFIIESGQCVGKCKFCGYSRTRFPTNVQVMKAELDKRMADADFDSLKVFASGSFLDDAQFPREYREYFIQKCKDKGIKKVMVESIPRFITPEKLREFEGLDLRISIGLEVADDAALAKLWKPFRVSHYAEAAKTIHAAGARLRTYLLANPPFVDDAKESLHKSVEFAKKHSDEIVVINTLPHSLTPLFDMWLAGEWGFLTKKEFVEMTKGLDGVELDPETFKFTPKFPPERKKMLEGVGPEFVDHPYYRVWQDWLARWYAPPHWKDIALLTPCSAKKPYSHSKTHALIFKALRGSANEDRVHRLVVSSPGVVPLEFDDHYPFNAYEWDESLETPAIKEHYTRVTKDRVKKFLEAHAASYKYFACFFRKESESYAAVRAACEELGLELIDASAESTGDSNPLFKQESLAKLRNAIDSIPEKQKIAIAVEK